MNVLLMMCLPRCRWDFRKNGKEKEKGKKEGREGRRK